MIDPLDESLRRLRRAVDAGRQRREAPPPRAGEILRAAADQPSLLPSNVQDVPAVTDEGHQSWTTFIRRLFGR